MHLITKVALALRVPATSRDSITFQTTLVYSASPLSYYLSSLVPILSLTLIYQQP